MPKQTELNVSYSVGIKANIGNYESADNHYSRSEKWDVSDIEVDEIDALYQERFEALQAELDAKATEFYKNTSK